MNSPFHLIALHFVFVGILSAAESSPKAFINGAGPGWRALTQEDFTNVNCKEDTWSFEKSGLIKCTGRPVGVIRTKKMVTNLELVQTLFQSLENLVILCETFGSIIRCAVQ